MSIYSLKSGKICKQVSHILVVSLFCTSLALVAFFPKSAFAINLSSCQTITIAGTYDLTQDIGSNGVDCLYIQTNGVTINGHGFTISGNIIANGIQMGQDQPGFSIILAEDLTVEGFVSTDGATGSAGNTGGAAGDVTVIDSVVNEIRARGGAGGAGASGSTGSTGSNADGSPGSDGAPGSNCDPNILCNGGNGGNGTDGESGGNGGVGGAGGNGYDGGPGGAGGLIYVGEYAVVNTYYYSGGAGGAGGAGGMGGTGGSANGGAGGMGGIGGTPGCDYSDPENPVCGSTGANGANGLPGIGGASGSMGMNGTNGSNGDPGSDGSLYQQPDSTPPSVSMSAPTPGGTVRGNSVTISANASDAGTGVAGVQFSIKIEGSFQDLDSEDTSEPYTISWNSASVSDGTVYFKATARDGNSNMNTSSDISVTVDNTGPVVSNVEVADGTDTTAQIIWTTNEGSTSYVAYGTSQAYGNFEELNSYVTSHSISLSDLEPDTLYHYRITSVDPVGNPGYSEDLTFTTPSALIPGCTNPAAVNYNPSATEDDGSCIYAPGAPGTPDLNEGSDTGSSNTDNITNDTTPSFSLSCEPGATVNLYYGESNLLASETCSSSFNTSLPEGSYNVFATQTNNNGTSTASSPLSVTIDTTAPSTAPGVPDLVSASDMGISSEDNYTNDSTPTFSIACVEGSDVVINLKEGDSILGSSVSPCDDGYEEITISLGEGEHLLSATQSDLAGNESSPSSNLTVTIDTSGPSEDPSVAPDLWVNHDAGSSSSDNVTNVTQPFFLGSCLDSNYVYLYVDGVFSISGNCNSSEYSFASAYIAPGSYSVTIKYADLAGNLTGASPALNPVVIDTTRPSTPGVPNLDADSDSASTTDDITNDSTPTFTVTCNESTSLVTLLEGVTVLGTGSCNGASASVTSSALSNGGHSVKARHTDLAGNTNLADSTTLSVTIDTTAPVATGIPDLTTGSDSASTTDNITNDNTPTFTVSCVSGTTVTLKEGSNTLGTGTCASSTVTITSSSLSDASFLIKALQTDTAGNVSSESTTLSVTIDTTAPIATLSSSSDTTVTESFSVTFTASEAIEGFTLGDITAVNATLSTLVTASSSEYSFIVTPTADGALTLLLATTTVSDTAGTDNAVSSNVLSRTVSLPSTATAATVLGPTAYGSAGGSPFVTNTIIHTSSTSSTPIITVQAGNIGTPNLLPTGLLAHKQVFTNTNGTPFIFVKNLTTTTPPNADTKKLQIFLNALGFSVSKNGVGSIGKETNSFGPATKKALLQFQKASGIKGANGVFGPTTRAYVNQLLKVVRGR